MKKYITPTTAKIFKAIAIIVGASVTVVAIASIFFLVTCQGNLK